MYYLTQVVRLKKAKTKWFKFCLSFKNWI